MTTKSGEWKPATVTGVAADNPAFGWYYRKYYVQDNDGVVDIGQDMYQVFHPQKTVQLYFEQRVSINEGFSKSLVDNPQSIYNRVEKRKEKLRRKKNSLMFYMIILLIKQMR